MIRIIDMREATCGEQAFAVWDTVVDRFVEVDGCQSFDGAGDLVELYKKDDTEYRLPKLGRILGLLPDWAKDKPNVR